jgi:hypothetical protein
MGTGASIWHARQRAWRDLARLRPQPIDFGAVSVLDGWSADELAKPGVLERLLPALGLNDEGLDEFPADLRSNCGGGLRIWQYPVQFGPYLAHLLSLNVRSYLEIGVRHGGSFVATVEVLGRRQHLDLAIGIDVISSPGMIEYARRRANVQFRCMNTQGPGFADFLTQLGSVDLVFIDSHHEEDQCRREFDAVASRARLIALHDVMNIRCPGVGRVWQDIRADERFNCVEFSAQYDARGPFMGIGLAAHRGLSRGGDPHTRIGQPA